MSLMGINVPFSILSLQVGIFPGIFLMQEKKMHYSIFQKKTIYIWREHAWRMTQKPKKRRRGCMGGGGFLRQLFKIWRFLVKFHLF